jgi:hypothetical protein
VEIYQTEKVCPERHKILYLYRISICVILAFLGGRFKVAADQLLFHVYLIQTAVKTAHSKQLFVVSLLDLFSFVQYYNLVAMEDG